MTDSAERGQQDTDSGETHRPVFATTHWSVVLAAGETETTRAQQALSRLCQTYWYPLYAYVRRRGSNPQDAEDLTQDFFARLLRKKSLSHLTREGGRFRSFLLTSLNRFLTDEWRRAHAQKRGGGQVISLDAGSAESRYGLEPADRHTPETLYDRAWALVLLESVFHRLRDEYARAGKAALFDELKSCLTGQRSAIPYAELASRLNHPENTLKTHVHRLRQRYRELLREEVGQIVASPNEIEEELRLLFCALA
jgi:RNA polymerase sigma-70 factor (ECF subfamily)